MPIFDQAIFPNIFNYFHTYISWQTSVPGTDPADPITSPISDAIMPSDTAVVDRAHIIVSDHLISELMEGDPLAQEAFKSSIQHQIVIICQCLQVNLVLID
jgi:hypothetical protein